MQAPADPPHLRRLACCASEPPCVLCPLLPENAHRSLKELAAAGLKANLPPPTRLPDAPANPIKGAGDAGPWP